MVGTSSRQGGFSALGPNVVTALATGTKIIHQWLILRTHVKKQQSRTLNRTANSNLNSKKVGCFAKLEKTACQQKKKRLSRKADLVFLSARTQKLDIFAKLVIEKIKLISHI